MRTAEIADVEGGVVDHIALSGNAKVLAEGMPGNDDVNLFGGKVQVYEEMSGSWQKRGNPIFGQGIGDLIGGVYMEETGEYESYWRFRVLRGKCRQQLHGIVGNWPCASSWVVHW